MTRGRPANSKIRQNIVEILYFMKKGYGYEIYRIYREIFAPATMRSIYYQLKKGTAIGEFKIHSIKKESGDYSWGEAAEKIYYSLGPNAKPKLLKRVEKYFNKNY